MKIGNDYTRRRTDRRRAWEHAADELKVDRTRLIERAVDMAHRTPAAFATAAAESEVAGLETDLPARLLELITGRSQRCAAALS